MIAFARFAVLGLAGTLALAGCGSEPAAPVGVETDPAISGALGDRLMVDPDMAGEQGAALSADGGQVTIPPEERSPAAIEAAKAEALAMAGGALQPLPQPVQGTGAALAQDAATAVLLAQLSRVSPEECSAKLQYSATWAARMPPELPVYPRGAVQEAAGIEGDGCDLRVVTFVTPVAPVDVIGFYHTRAGKAGYAADYRTDGGQQMLGGRKGGKAFVIHARKRDDGLTEVDLVAGGK